MFVRLPHYLRVVAIFLILASPILATLYFAPTLDHLNKAMYHLLSFALLALSTIIAFDDAMPILIVTPCADERQI
jgi:hypothetical protein